MQIKRNFLILFLILTLVFQQSLLAKKSSQNCLWKITNEKNSVYLLGSIHLLSKASYPLNSAIDKAFEDAQVLAFEINLDSLQIPKIQQLMLSKAMFSDGKILPKVLKPKTYEFATQQVKEMGLTIEQFHPVKPWFFAVSLMTLKLQKMGFNPELGVDKHFFQQAKQQGKRIIGLETAEYQIKLFDQISEQNPDDIILQILSEFDVFDKQINELVTSWSAGNVKELNQIMFKSFADYPKIYQEFVVQRNLNWLPQIEKFCKDTENYLIIVGTGHLVGKDGLVKLLEERGFSLEQM